MHIEKKELPECLKRARPSGWSCDIADGTYLSQHLVVELFVDGQNWNINKSIIDAMK